MKKKTLSVPLDKVREVLSLRAGGLSLRKIADAVCVSPNTVKRWLERCDAHKIDHLSCDSADNDALLSIIHLTRGPNPNSRKGPDLTGITEALESGSTVQKEYERYKEEVGDGRKPLSTSAFYQRVATHSAKQSDLARKTVQEWMPGEYMQIDYAGDAIELAPGPDGKKYKARIFVAVLCHSRYTFARATLDTTTRSWVECLIKAFEFFGGIPKNVILDNDVALVTNATRGNPKFTKLFSETCEYYGILPGPARVKHPRDKGLVENAVKYFTTHFIHTIKKGSLLSIRDVNTLLADEVRRLNLCEMRRYGISRKKWFEQAEHRRLRKLPKVRLTADGKVVEHKADENGWVRYEGHFYRMPSQYRGQIVQICRPESTRLRFSERSRGMEITTYPNYADIDISEGRGFYHEHPEYRGPGECTPAERLKENFEKISSIHPSAAAYFQEFVKRRKGESGAVAETLHLFCKELEKLSPASVEWCCIHLQEMGIYDPDGILPVLRAAAKRPQEETTRAPSGGKGALLHSRETFCKGSSNPELKEEKK